MRLQLGFANKTDYNRIDGKGVLEVYRFFSIKRIEWHQQHVYFQRKHVM